MTFLEACAEVVKMAKEEQRVCYLYGSEKWNASFEYWNDWLLMAYPDGRKILSVAGGEYTDPKKFYEMESK